MATHEIPYLFKLCDKRHNLALDGHSIRLGKLSYYRSFEQQEIGDTQEGVKKHMGYVNQQEEKIPIYHFGINDSLIFSTTTEIEGKIADYNSCYKITDAVRFSHLVGDCIFDMLLIGDLQFPSLDVSKFTLKNIRNLDIIMQRRRVQYFEQDDIAPQHYDFDHVVVKEDLFDMNYIAFWKNKTYEQQKEFRLTFDVYHKDDDGFENYAQLPDPYLDVDLSKYKHELPVELVY